MSWSSRITNGHDTPQLDRISTLLADTASDEHIPGPPLTDLPILTSLSHTNPQLSAPSFSVEDFLVSRSHTSLSDLRLELRDYSATLKEELVQLINDDYAAFISLSTDLRGEGTRLDRLKFPLGGVRREIEISLDQLKLVQETVQERLNERSALRDEKSLLHLLLKLSESLARLENLLLIAPLQDGMIESLGENTGISIQVGVGPNDPRDGRSRTNRVKHLSRVSVEFTQLMYHVDKARTEKCAFVDSIQWRVDRIRSTLCSDLNHLFATILLFLTPADIGGSKMPPSEPEKTRWRSDLKECLRTYDELGLWRDAEEVVRREVVKGFVKKTIFSGALAVPHSPLIPRTPFPTQTTSSGQLTPGTPYTPLTARPRKTSFEPHFTSITESHLPLLDDSDDALASLYNKLLRFVERDLKDLMELAEVFSVRRRRSVDTNVAMTSSRAASSDAQKLKDGFEFMSNVIWAEIGEATIEELGTVIFAVGRPNEFRKNYTTTQNFLAALEFLAPSLHAVESMRCHPTFLAFQRRWQLPVYFQLRWKDIVGRLEDALSIPMELGAEHVKDKQLEEFLTPQAVSVFDAILNCWSADVCIPELGHRFWRLTLQILSRFKTWLDSSHQPVKVVAAMTTEKAGSSSPSSRSPTPIPPSESLTESTIADEAVLMHYGTVISDIKHLEKKVYELWITEISAILPDVVDGEEGASPSEALKHISGTLTDLIPSFSSHIIAILIRRSCEALVLVRSIPSQYRAMSSKRLPTEPSHFVPNILKPVKVFLGAGEKGILSAGTKEEFGPVWATEIFEAVCQRYISYLAAMRKTEESLRRLKKGKMSALSLFGSSSSATFKGQEGKDEERVRVQMVLDVAEFGKDARSLGVDIEKNVAFHELESVAAQGYAEGS